MRFEAVKSEETQGAASVFGLRAPLIRRRRQTIDALHGHLTESGQAVRQGGWNARVTGNATISPDAGRSTRPSGATGASRHRPHLVAERGELPRPVTGARASLHRGQAGLGAAEGGRHLATAQLPAQSTAVPPTLAPSA